MDDTWYFEVGGASKDHRQIQFLQQGYILADNILIPEKTKLPLWLLGLLW